MHETSLIIQINSEIKTQKEKTTETKERNFEPDVY